MSSFQASMFIGFTPRVRANGGCHSPFQLSVKLPRSLLHVKAQFSLPLEVDWRREGALTSIKNQKICGSCWAFSSITAVEAAHYIATHSLLTLSPQELVDYDFESDGCEHGSVGDALNYIQRFGVGLDAHYPYIAYQQVRKGDGIYTHKPTLGEELSYHSVTIVGFGSNKDGDYWCVQNSWGDTWGAGGLIYIRRNTGDQQGICGINKYPCYPIIRGG
ncbi:ervatamin-B-like [Lotus japonicus]|uniref:ervatamin-B-like n=1 Tax=Lotus japonicus TaxID=34305 RepID=UPI0025848839|nr:ervatamin-B-like [Lotus japonicus]